MITTLRRMSLFERLYCRLFPGYRRRRDEELRRAIGWLLDHPDEPCILGDRYIPNGFGAEGKEVR